MKCSRQSARKCLAPSETLLDRSHFTAVGADGLTTLRLTCCWCRKVPPISPAAGPSKRVDPPSRTRDDSGNTPSTRRSRFGPQRPVSPSPVRPVLPLNTVRPQRNRRAPVRPYDTPPTPPPVSQSPPPLPTPPPRPAVAEKKCKVCKMKLPLALFYNPKTAAASFLSCEPCRARRRGRHRRTRAPPPSTPSPCPSARSRQGSPSPSSAPRRSRVLQDKCITEEEELCLQTFRKELDAVAVRHCGNCNQAWFDLIIEDGRCQHCRQAERSFPGKWTARNNMDPGPDLQELCRRAGRTVPAIPTQVEEMLISKAHVQLSMWRIGGRQAKYSGHTCLFPRDTANVTERLPLYPEGLDVLIIRSKSPADNRSFANRLDFTVRRQVVLDNLEALIHFHPSYRHIAIDRTALDELPENGSVFHRLQATDAPPDDSRVPPPVPHDANVNDFDPDHLPGVLLPNMPDFGREEDEIREGMERMYGDMPPVHPIPDPPTPSPAVLTAPSLRNTPINEYEQGSTHLIDAFPFLFPSGKADINAERGCKIREGPYYRHLMRYHDGRFARHPRFRYFAFNSVMRHQARQKAGYFVSRSNEDAALRAEDIADLLSGDARVLAQRVHRMGATLRGSSAYWGQRSKDLQQMVRQEGSPTAFFTLSAADMQWSDLQRHMPLQAIGVETENVRQRRTAANVNDNPAIAAYYFHLRFNLFFKHVMTPLFGITDYWYRYEWQSRGSSHVHGLFWSDQAPSADNIHLSDSSTGRAYIRYWRDRMTAVNPGAGVPPAAQHPSSIPMSELSYTCRELAELLNRVQRHTSCSEAYCLRRPKGSAADAVKQCRFHFPQPLRDEMTLGREGRTLKVYAERNDELLNLYNPALIMGWRANIDIGAISDRAAVLNYISKYVTKSERPSADFPDIMLSTARHLEGNTAARVVYQKMLNKLVIERDWSAQEVMHMLLDCQAFGSSREFSSLGLTARWSRRLRDPNAEVEDGLGGGEVDDDGVEALGWKDKYYIRPEGDQFDQISLYQWAKSWRASHKRTGLEYVLKEKDRIVRLWPAYAPGDQDSDEFQDWCRAKLLLHHPHRNAATIGILQDGEAWSDAYERCVNDCDHEQEDTLPTRHRIGNPGDVTGDDSFSEGDPIDEEQVRDDFMWMALLGPGRQRGDGLPDHLQQLGRRDIDKHYDWMADAHRWGDGGLDSRAGYLKQQKANGGWDDEQGALIDADTLNGAQLRIYTKVRLHAEAYRNGLNPAPFLLNVDGTAGTGKSYLIDAISQLLAHFAPADKAIVRRLAPTGVAAFNIKGETCHSALGFRVNNKEVYTSVGPQKLLALQEAWSAVRYLIIDEKSMVGTLQLQQINQRLDLIIPNTGLPFGGLSVLLVGDFGQLPPVGDRPLYSDNQAGDNKDKAVARKLGRKLFALGFKESIELDVVMRQAGTDDTTAAFKATLGRLRSAELSLPQDYELLASRNWDRVTLHDRAQFEDCTLLSGLNRVVDLYNLNRLNDAHRPVLRCPAQHSSRMAQSGTDEEAQGLQLMIYLMKGAKVMITRNIWCEAGLTNGTAATVEEIGFRPNDTPMECVPAVVMVACPSYTGPTLWRSANGVPIIPIVPATAVWKRDTTQCSRTQLPLKLSYAMTIHKSQGMTMDRVRIDLGAGEVSPGMTFVGLSRVKTLDGLLFVNALTEMRLKAAGAPTPGRAAQRSDDARRRLLGFAEMPVLL